MKSLSSRGRGLLAIVGGSAGAQLVGLASAPVISRLYSPREYGVFAVVNAVLLPLATVTALRLDFAVPVPDDRQEALVVARLGIRVSIGLGVLFTALAMLGHQTMAGWLGLEGGLVLLWAPAIATMLACFTLLNQVAIREQMYAAIGLRNLLQGSGVVVFQILAGLAHAGAHGLAGGLAVGQLAGVISLAWVLRDLPWRAEPHDAWSSVLRRYRRYPLIMAPSGLANTLGLQLPILLMASLYGGQVSGWLGMTQRILALPVTLFGVALSQVFLGEFGAAKRSAAEPRALAVMFRRASVRLALVGSLGAVAVVASAPWMFSTVLGHAWRMSGSYAQALAVSLALQMVASPLSQTLIVMGRVATQAAWDVGRLGLAVGSVYLAHNAGLSAQTAVGALGGALAVAYGVSWLLSWQAVQRYASDGTAPSDGPPSL